MTTVRQKASLVTVLGLVAGVLVGANGVRAQSSASASRLTLAQAAEQALAHYPRVSAARFAAEGAASAALGAAATRWPSLALSTTASRFQEPMLVTPIHGFSPESIPPFDRSLFQGTAAIRYTIFDGQGRGARIEAARAESESASIEVVAVSQSVIVQVSATYMRVLGMARVLDAQNRRIAALESERGRVQQMLDAGRAADVDVMRVEAVLAEARAEQVSLAADLDLAERQLSRLTGLQLDAVSASQLAGVTLRDTVMSSRDSLLADALRSNPGVLQGQRLRTAAEARSKVARSKRYPQLDLAAHYQGWASASDNPIVEWNVGVAVTWPLFTGGAVNQQIRRSDAELSVAGERLRLAEMEAADQLDTALSSVREARARVRSLTTAVSRAAEVARIEQLRLDEGAGVQRDYLDAEASLFANSAALVQAQYAEVLSRVNLARTTGHLDMEWLARNLGGTS